ncbi:MAG TPA: NAD(P)-dependent oxidoreductase [Acidimicrobiales bacterium]|nr:NAD(P)-dependent oxidoreductase [Acidimicrobiales bacterium]
MRILVTGGAGYIGSVLVPDLLSSGHHVTVLDNFMYRQPSLASSCWQSELELVVGDVRNVELVTKLASTCDIVIPLAAIVGAPACENDPYLANDVNLKSTLELFRNLSSNQIVLMPTTNSAYGSGDENNKCDETSPLRPLSQYAREKVAVEEALMDRGTSVSLRLATVFGMSPRMRLDLLVNNFVWRAIEDHFVIIFEGHFTRNYIHVRDVASAFKLAIGDLDNFTGEIFNVGLSSANISKFNLCEEIARAVPDFVFLEASLKQDPDQRNYIVSNAKIEALGFDPQFTLQAGIEELVKGLPMLRNLQYRNA